MFSAGKQSNGLPGLSKWAALARASQREWVGGGAATDGQREQRRGGWGVGAEVWVAGGQLSTDGTALAQSAHNNWGESGTGEAQGYN